MTQEAGQTSGTTVAWQDTAIKERIQNDRNGELERSLTSPTSCDREAAKIHADELDGQLKSMPASTEPASKKPKEAQEEPLLKSAALVAPDARLTESAVLAPSTHLSASETAALGTLALSGEAHREKMAAQSAAAPLTVPGEVQGQTESKGMTMRPWDK